MCQGPGWMRLDGNARLGKDPGTAEFMANCLVVITTAGRAKKPALGFQYIACRGKPPLYKIGRQHRAFSRAARMKRLCHSTKILTKPCRLTARQPQNRRCL